MIMYLGLNSNDKMALWSDNLFFVDNMELINWSLFLSYLDPFIRRN
jgi:hypothetical protein